MAKTAIDRVCSEDQACKASDPVVASGAAGPVDANGLTEAEFLAAYDMSIYDRPSLTADILIFRESEGEADPDLLMIRRKGHPFIDHWALPGGFAERGETIEETAARELEEETGITGMTMELVGVYSKPGRDPRGWTVTAAFMARVAAGQVRPVAGDDAREVGWVKVKRGDAAMSGDSVQKAGSESVPLVCADGKCINDELAFDHLDIITDAARQYWRTNG